MANENNAPQSGGKMLKVTLTRSIIRARGDHKATVKSLGLHRINDSHTLPDNPAVRGMIKSVEYLVKFEEVQG